MPKMKTCRGAAKRFKLTGTGKIKDEKKDNYEAIIRKKFANYYSRILFFGKKSDGWKLSFFNTSIFFHHFFSPSFSR